MRVYLDLCAIQRPFDDQAQPRVRAEAEAVLSVLDLRKAGSVGLVTSGVHVVEIAKCPFPGRRAYVEDVLAVSDVYTAGVPAVLRRAQSYQARGIKRFDAIHLASAVEAGADFFCTTDDPLLKRGRDANTSATTVVSPLELIVHLSRG